MTRRLPAVTRRTAPLLLALALIATGCGEPTEGDASTTSAPDTAGTTTSTVPPGPVILESIDDPELGPLEASREANDGFLGIQDALDLFAAVYGPIPGADSTRFDPRPHDASMAIRNVFRVFDDLTAEQQAAVSAAAGPTTGGAGVDVILASTRGGSIEAQIASLEAQIAGHLGRPLGLAIDVVTGHAFANPRVLADAAPLGGGEPFRMPYDTCQVRVSVGVVTASTLAHEVFHCFQFTFAGRTAETPDWIQEGQAEWVGARVGGVDADIVGSWNGWVTGQLVSLFSKDYNAVGFYWVIEQAGIDPWTVMPAMFGMSSAAAVEATGLSGVDAVRWMGTTTARDDIGPSAGLSSAWAISASDAPATAVRARVRVSEESPFERDRGLAPFSDSAAFDFRLDGDVVTLDLQSEAGAFEFVEKDFTPLDGAFFGRYCIREGGCSCGSDGEEDLEEGSDRLFMSVGSATGGSASISSTIEDYDDEFADGEWTGELISTVIYTDIEGSEGVSEPLGAPFEMTISDRKVVEGTYSVAMYQTIQSEGGFAEGVGMVTGYITGCSFAPRLVATAFDFEGAMTTDVGTIPMVFSIPLDDTGNAPVWQFDESDDENSASGMLITTPYLEYMRGVGVGVNEVEIHFVATRTG